MLPSLTPAFPLESLHLKPYMTWSGTFSELLGHTVIQLSLSSCQSWGAAVCTVILLQQGLEADHALFLLDSSLFFPLQPSTRTELQYVGISKCQDCIMLTVCCDTSLITFDSFIIKIEAIVGRIWYVLYSCLPQGLYI